MTSTIGGIQLDALPSYLTGPMELPPGSTQPGSAGSTLARNGVFGTANRRMSILLSGRSGPAGGVTSSNGPRVPTQFERLVENFISKHVRDYVDEHMRRTTDAAIAAASASPAAAGLAVSHMIMAIPKSPTLKRVNEHSSQFVLDTTQQSVEQSTGKLQPPLDDSAMTTVNTNGPVSSPHLLDAHTPTLIKLSPNPASPVAPIGSTHPSLQHPKATPGRAETSGPLTSTLRTRRNRSSSSTRHKPRIDIQEVIRSLQPVAMEGWAAVVMCDVSGYSSLTSYLADRGPDGAEILSKIMKGYLDKIIQIISLHGGDIVKFVGDAVIIYWKYQQPDPKWIQFAEQRLRRDHPTWDVEKVAEQLAKAKQQRQGMTVVKAAECCLDLLAKLNNYRVRIPPLRSDPTKGAVERELRIHLGIGAGKIYDVHVGGDPGRWEHLVVGDAMDQLAQVLDLAKPGQVALSMRAFEYMKPCLVLSRVQLEYETKKCIILNSFDKSAVTFLVPENVDDDGDDFMVLWDIQTGDPTSTGNVELYKQYVAQSALFKLDSDIQSASPFQLNQGVNHLMSLNELRQVTTLFIKIGSLSFSPVDQLEDNIKEQEGYIEEQRSNLASLEHQLRVTVTGVGSMNTDKQSTHTGSDSSITSTEKATHIAELTAKIAEARSAFESSQRVLCDLVASHKEALRDALALCQAAMTAVQVALKKFEGILRQFHVDDKGAVILAFFGLPPLAHKNDAALGIQAGLMICEELKKHFETFSMGLTTGVVSIGGVGNSLRTEYALMGDGINMAARIMGLPAAKRSLVCDERTFTLCHTSFEFEELGQAVVKGKAMPINVYRPVRARQAQQSESDSAPAHEEMVGRHRERQIVKEVFERHSRQGASNCSVLIEGEGGQGLSTFGAHIRDMAEAMGYEVCIATSVESERSTPYFALRGIVRDFLRILDEAHQHSEEDPNRTQVPQLVRPRSLLASAILNSSHGRLSGGCTSPGSPVESLESVTNRGTTTNTTSTPQLMAAATDLGFRASSVVHVSLPGSLDDVAMTEFEAAARKTFSRLPEIEELVHLLALIFPEEFPGDRANPTDVTSGGGGITIAVTRQQDLASMVTALCNAVCSINRTLAIVPDAHFMDRASWEIISRVMDSCARLLVVTLSYPHKHMMPSVTLFYESLRRRSTLITLLGLSVPEVGEMVLKAYTRITANKALASSTPPTSVDLSLSAKIASVSSGNPLFIMSLVVTLCEKGSLEVTSSGVLTVFNPNGGGGNALVLDTIMPGSDLHSLIVSQFDRLDPTFQMFLKISSVLGQHFLLRDVLDYFEMEQREGGGGGNGGSGGGRGTTARAGDLGITPRDTDTLIQDISTYDKFSFLTVQGNTLSYEADVLVSFKNTIIRDSIYSTMLIAQRQSLHLGFARFYEHRLAQLAGHAPSSGAAQPPPTTQAVDHQLILKVYEHYNKVDGHLEKKLLYLEQVAHLCYAMASTNEAVGYYRDLLTMPMIAKWTLGDGSLKLPSGRKITPVERSKWHKELGDALVSMHKLAQAEAQFLDALAWVGYEIPRQWWVLGMRSFVEYFRINLSKYRFTGGRLGQVDASGSVARPQLDTGYPPGAPHSSPISPVKPLATAAPLASGSQAANGQGSVSNEGRLPRIRAALMSLIELQLLQEQIPKWRYLVWSGTNLTPPQSPNDPVSAAFLALSGLAIFTTKKNHAKAIACLERSLAMADVTHPNWQLPSIAASSPSSHQTSGHIPAPNSIAAPAHAPPAGPATSRRASALHRSLNRDGTGLTVVTGGGGTLSRGGGGSSLGTGPGNSGPSQAGGGPLSLESGGLARTSRNAAEQAGNAIVLTCAAVMDLLLSQFQSSRDRCARAIRLGSTEGLGNLVVRSHRMLILMDLLEGRHAECKIMANDLWVKTKDRSRDGRFWSLANLVLLEVALKGPRTHSEDPTFLHFVTDMRHRVELAVTEDMHQPNGPGRRLVETWMDMEFEFWRRRGGGTPSYRGLNADGTPVTSITTNGGQTMMGGGGAGGSAAAGAGSSTGAIGSNDDRFFADRIQHFTTTVGSLKMLHFHALLGVIGMAHLISVAYETDLTDVLGTRRTILNLLSVTRTMLVREFSAVPWTRWLLVLVDGLKHVLAGNKMLAVKFWHKQLMTSFARDGTIHGITGTTMTRRRAKSNAVRDSMMSPSAAATAATAGDAQATSIQKVWLAKVVAAKLIRYAEGTSMINTIKSAWATDVTSLAVKSTAKLPSATAGSGGGAGPGAADWGWGGGGGADMS